MTSKILHDWKNDGSVWLLKSRKQMASYLQYICPGKNGNRLYELCTFLQVKHIWRSKTGMRFAMEEYYVKNLHCLRMCWIILKVVSFIKCWTMEWTSGTHTLVVCNTELTEYRKTLYYLCYEVRENWNKTKFTKNSKKLWTNFSINFSCVCILKAVKLDPCLFAIIELEEPV